MSTVTHEDKVVLTKKLLHIVL